MPTGTASLLVRVSKYGWNRHPEDQLSEVFAAVFNSSPQLRASIATLLRKRFGRRCPKHLETFVCTTQIPRDHSRFDIVFGPHDALRKRSELVLENKLGAPLNLPQLIKHRKSGARYLGAITERFPEVPPAQLRQLGITAIRWHEIHHLLTGFRVRDPVERYLTEQLAVYLEELSLASLPLTPHDLRTLGETLRAVAGERRSPLARDVNFGAADRLIAVLDDVSYDIIADYPKLRRWGPGYWRDNETGAHHIGIGFRRRSGGRHNRWIDCAFEFPQKAGAPRLVRFVEGKNYIETDKPVSLSRLLAGGYLSRDKVSRIVRESVGRYAHLL